MATVDSVMAISGFLRGEDLDRLESEIARSHGPLVTFVAPTRGVQDETHPAVPFRCSDVQALLTEVRWWRAHARVAVAE